MAGRGRPASQGPFPVVHDVGCGHCGSLFSAIEKGTGNRLSLSCVVSAVPVGALGYSGGARIR